MSRAPRRATLVLAAACAAVGLAAAAAVGVAGDRDDHRDRDGDRGGHHDPRPLVIGHRGASGHRPEHTLGSYELAVRMGADFVEPDLVSTKDGVLVARHEPEIEDTTDIEQHPEFATRRRTQVIDGVAFEGFFVSDFTLAELKTLRATERLPQVRQENTLYDGRYEVPTLQEVIDLAERLSRRYGRTIGIYPETKHPSWHDSIGLSLEEPLTRTLRRNGLDRRDAPVFVQSFEVANLKELNRALTVRIVQLFGASGAPQDFVEAGDPRTYDDMATPAGLREISRYADGIGPDKNRVIPVLADGRLGAPTPLVADAHRVGLQVHPYTFRNENQFLPPALRRPPVGAPAGTAPDPRDYGDVFTEYAAFFAAGVDGLFSDNPDTAVEARSDLD